MKCSLAPRTCRCSRAGCTISAMRAVTPRSLHVDRPKGGWRRVVCGALVLALPVLSRAGRAEPGEPAKQATSVYLAWAGGARGCPTAKQTEAAVEEILGHR